MSEFSPEVLTPYVKRKVRKEQERQATLPRQMIGLPTSIDEVNTKVERITQSHERAFGYAPSPSLTLDVLRAPVTEDDYDGLFDEAVGSKRLRIVQNATRAAFGPNSQFGVPTQPFAAPGVPEEPEPPTTAGTAEDLYRRWRAGDITQNEMYEAVKNDPVTASALADLMQGNVTAPTYGAAPTVPVPTAGQYTGVRESAEEYVARRGELTELAAINATQEQLTRERLGALGAYVPDGPLWTFQKGADLAAASVLGEARDNWVSRALAEIGESTLYMPAGLYALGRAPVVDFKRGFETTDFSLTGNIFSSGDWSFDETTTLGKEFYKGFMDGWNPGEHPGFFLMNLWTVATLGAGGVARVGAIGRGVAEAETVAGATKAVVRGAIRRPDAGTFEIGIGAVREHVNLFENAAARAAQRAVLSVRQAATEAKYARYAREGLANPWRQQPGAYAYDRMLDYGLGVLSLERKVRAKMIARARAETVILSTPVRELDRFTRVRLRSTQVAGEVLMDPDGAKTWGTIQKLGAKRRIGLEKAIQIEGSDLLGDWNARAAQWRQAHERWIQEAADAAMMGTLDENVAIAQIKAHAAQIQAIDWAVEAMANPPKWWPELVTKVRAVVNQGEWAKVTYQNLPAEAIPERVAASAMNAAGIPLHFLTDIPSPLWEKYGRKVKPGDRVFVRDQPDAGKVRKVDTDGGTVTIEWPVKAGRERVTTVDPETGQKRTSLRERKRPEAVVEETYRLEDVTFEDEHLVRTPREQIREDAFRVPEQLARVETRPPLGAGEPVPGRFGKGPTGLPPELEHEYTGSAVRQGFTRIDVSNLTIEQTVRAIRLGKQRDIFMRAHTPGPNGETPITNVRVNRNQILIRMDRKIPDEFRRMFRDDDGVVIKAGEIKDLGDETLDDFDRWMFPREKDIDSEGPFGVTEGEYGYIDPNFLIVGEDGASVMRWLNDLKPSDIVTRGVSKTRRASAIAATPLFLFNEAGRLGILFSRAAYALNALGSAAILTYKQGPLAPLNLGRALISLQHYGPEITRYLDEAAGTTGIASISGGSQSLSGLLQHLWTPITDKFFRRAAQIHQLRRAGIDINNDLPRVLYRKGDETPEEAAELDALQKKVTEAQQRGRSDAVDFDNLSLFEQAVLRHVFFVYAWITRSAVWSLKTMVENPIKTNVLMTAGQLKEDEVDRLIGDTPEWFKKMGYFVSDHDPDTNEVKVSQWSWALPHTIIGQMVNAGTALVTGDPYESMENWLGQGPEAILHMISGRDQYGQPYKGSPFVGAIKEQAKQTPYGAAYTRGERAEDLAAAGPVQPPSRVDPYALRKQESKALERPSFTVEGFWDTWGSTIVGGLGEKKIADEGDPLHARFWRDLKDLNPEAKWQHDLQLMKDQMKVMGDLIGDQPDPGVVRAMVFAETVSARFLEEKKEKGFGAETSFLEKTKITLSLLEEKGWIPSDIAKQVRARINDPTDVDFRSEYYSLVDTYAGGKQLREFNEDAKTVGLFVEGPQFPWALSNLEEDGFGDYKPVANAPDSARVKYGRLYLAYTKQDALLRQEARDEFLTPEEQQAVFQRLTDLHSQNDQAVVVDGVKFPPLAGMKWALFDDDERREEAAFLLTGKKWEWLSHTDKQVLIGREYPDSVREGWNAWFQFLRDKQAEYDEYNRTKDPDDPRKTISRKLMNHWAEGERTNPEYPGWFADYERSRRPLIERFRETIAYRDSKNQKKWDAVIADAQILIRNVRKAQELADSGETLSESGYISRQKDEWKRYVRDELRQEIQADPAFWEEVKLYGGTKFLLEMVNP